MFRLMDPQPPPNSSFLFTAVYCVQNCVLNPYARLYELNVCFYTQYVIVNIALQLSHASPYKGIFQNSVTATFK